MDKNIVIFGPANVGKSTIVGYLIAKIEKDFDFNRFLSKIRYEPWFKMEERYRYISDKGKLERERQFDKQGQTRHMHLRYVVDGSTTLQIIDTPGAEHAEKERLKGISFGEVGIFVLEAKQLLEKSDGVYGNLLALYTFLNPYYFWLKLKGPDNLLIVLSKFDLVDYSHEYYLKALNSLRSLCDNQKIEAIPISIDRINETDMNILSRSNRAIWYSGLTLKESIDQKLMSLTCDKSSDEPLFIKMDKSFNRSGIGKVFRGKIISGTIRVDDTVKIGPVVVKNKLFSHVHARIQTINLSNTKDADEATKGEIVGLNIKIIHKRCDKDEMELTDASIICQTNQSIIYGNSFRFVIADSEIGKISILKSMAVVFFGKLIMTKVLRIHKVGINQIAVVLSIDTEDDMKILFPVDYGKLRFTDFLIKNQKNEFVTGKLDEFGVIKEMAFTFGKRNLDDIRIKRTITKSNYEIKDDILVLHSIKSPVSIFYKTKKYFEKYVNLEDDVMIYDFTISKESI